MSLGNWFLPLLVGLHLLGLLLLFFSSESLGSGSDAHLSFLFSLGLLLGLLLLRVDGFFALLEQLVALGNLFLSLVLGVAHLEVRDVNLVFLFLLFFLLLLYLLDFLFFFLELLCSLFHFLVLILDFLLGERLDGLAAVVVVLQVGV